MSVHVHKEVVEHETSASEQKRKVRTPTHRLFDDDDYYPETEEDEEELEEPADDDISELVSAPSGEIAADVNESEVPVEQLEPTIQPTPNQDALVAPADQPVSATQPSGKPTKQETPHAPQPSAKQFSGSGAPLLPSDGPPQTLGGALPLVPPEPRAATFRVASRYEIVEEQAQAIREQHAANRAQARAQAQQDSRITEMSLAFDMAKQRVTEHGDCEKQRLHDELFGEHGVMGRLEQSALEVENEIFSYANQYYAFTQDNGAQLADDMAEVSESEQQRARDISKDFSAQAGTMLGEKKKKYRSRKNAKAIKAALIKLVAEARQNFKCATEDLVDSIEHDSCEIQNAILVQTAELAQSFDPNQDQDGCGTVSDMLADLLVSAREQVTALYKQGCSTIDEATNVQLQTLDQRKQRDIAAAQSEAESAALTQVDKHAAFVASSLQARSDELQAYGADELDARSVLGGDGSFSLLYGSTAKRLFTAAQGHVTADTLVDIIAQPHLEAVTRVTDEVINMGHEMEAELEGQIQGVRDDTLGKFNETFEKGMEHIVSIFSDGAGGIIEKVEKLAEQRDQQLADLDTASDKRAQELSTKSENFWSGFWSGLKKTLQVLGGFLWGVLKAALIAIVVIVAIVIIVALAVAVIAALIYAIGAIGLGALAAAITSILLAIASGLLGLILSTVGIGLLMLVGAYFAYHSIKKAWELSGTDGSAWDIGQAWGQAAFDVLTIWIPPKFIQPLKNTAFAQKASKGLTNVAAKAGGTKAGQEVLRVAASEGVQRFLARTQNNAASIDDLGNRGLDLVTGGDNAQNIMQQGAARAFQKVGYKTPQARAAAKADEQAKLAKQGIEPPRYAAELSELEKVAEDVGVPVVRNDGTNGVRVTYRDGVRIEVGPNARPFDVQMHLATAEALKEYDGFLGWCRWMADDLRNLFKRGVKRVGSRAWEAGHEVTKLRAIEDQYRGILHELEQIEAKGTARAKELASTNRAVIEAEIKTISQQLQKYELEIGASGRIQGKGHIAAEYNHIQSFYLPLRTFLVKHPEGDDAFKAFLRLEEEMNRTEFTNFWRRELVPLTERYSSSPEEAITRIRQRVDELDTDNFSLRSANEEPPWVYTDPSVAHIPNDELVKFLETGYHARGDDILIRLSDGQWYEVTQASSYSFGYSIHCRRFDSLDTYYRMELTHEKPMQIVAIRVRGYDDGFKWMDRVAPQSTPSVRRFEEPTALVSKVEAPVLDGGVFAQGRASALERGDTEWIKSMFPELAVTPDIDIPAPKDCPFLEQMGLDQLEDGYRILTETRIGQIAQETGAALFHGSNSSALLAFSNFGGNTSAIKPVGELFKRGQVPFAGELSVGLVGGRNASFGATSTTFLSHYEWSLSSYTKWDGWSAARAEEQIASIKAHQNGRDDVQRLKLQIEEKRLAQWHAMDASEKELVEHGFPVLFGFKLTSKNKYSGTSEVEVLGGFEREEVAVIFVPEKKIPVVKDLVGDIRVESIESIGGKVDDVVDEAASTIKPRSESGVTTPKAKATPDIETRTAQTDPVDDIRQVDDGDNSSLQRRAHNEPHSDAPATKPQELYNPKQTTRAEEPLGSNTRTEAHDSPPRDPDGSNRAAPNPQVYPKPMARYGMDSEYSAQRAGKWADKVFDLKRMHDEMPHYADDFESFKKFAPRADAETKAYLDLNSGGTPERCTKVLNELKRSDKKFVTMLKQRMVKYLDETLVGKEAADAIKRVLQSTDELDVDAFTSMMNMPGFSRVWEYSILDAWTSFDLRWRLRLVDITELSDDMQGMYLVVATRGKSDVRRWKEMEAYRRPGALDDRIIVGNDTGSVEIKIRDEAHVTDPRDMEYLDQHTTEVLGEANSRHYWASGPNSNATYADYSNLHDFRRWYQDKKAAYESLGRSDNPLKAEYDYVDGRYVAKKDAFNPNRNTKGFIQSNQMGNERRYIAPDEGVEAVTRYNPEASLGPELKAYMDNPEILRDLAEVQPDILVETVDVLNGLRRKYLEMFPGNPLGIKRFDPSDYVKSADFEDVVQRFDVFAKTEAQSTREVFDELNRLLNNHSSDELNSALFNTSCRDLLKPLIKEVSEGSAATVTAEELAETLSRLFAHSRNAKALNVSEYYGSVAKLCFLDTGFARTFLRDANNINELASQVHFIPSSFSADAMPTTAGNDYMEQIIYAFASIADPTSLKAGPESWLPPPYLERLRKLFAGKDRSGELDEFLALTQRRVGHVEPKKLTSTGKASESIESGSTNRTPDIDDEYTPMTGQPELGGVTRNKIILRGDDGKHYLFKPCKDEAVGAQHGAKGPQALPKQSAAASLVANRLGVATPSVKVVKYKGEIGSLQEFYNDPNIYTYRNMTGYPQYRELTKGGKKQLADLRIFDYLISTGDRTDNILGIQSGDDILGVIAIDNDYAFSKQPGAWSRWEMRWVTQEMHQNLQKLKSDWGEVKVDLQQLLEGWQIEGVAQRLDDALQRIDDHLAGDGKLFDGSGSVR